MEAVSPNAFYDSDNRPDPPKCHPNTRVAVINKIIDWANGMTDTNAFMLWLYGPAGAGKTAIARRIAELFAKYGLLLASFLFFRSDPNIRKKSGCNVDLYSLYSIDSFVASLLKYCNHSFGGWLSCTIDSYRFPYSHHRIPKNSLLIISHCSI